MAFCCCDACENKNINCELQLKRTNFDIDFNEACLIAVFMLRNLLEATADYWPHMAMSFLNLWNVLVTVLERHLSFFFCI